MQIADTGHEGFGGGGGCGDGADGYTSAKPDDLNDIQFFTWLMKLTHSFLFYSELAMVGMCLYFVANAFGHALVLRGAIGAMVDPGLNAWDLAASRLLVPEAGGAIYTRPSAKPDKVDAILGRPEIVDLLVAHLGWE